MAGQPGGYGDTPYAEDDAAAEYEYPAGATEDGNVGAVCGVGFTGDVFPLVSVLAPKPPLVTPVTVADRV